MMTKDGERLGRICKNPKCNKRYIPTGRFDAFCQKCRKKRKEWWKKQNN